MPGEPRPNEVQRVREKHRRRARERPRDQIHGRRRVPGGFYQPPSILLVRHKVQRCVWDDPQNGGAVPFEEAEGALGAPDAAEGSPDAGAGKVAKIGLDGGLRRVCKVR